MIEIKHIIQTNVPVHGPETSYCAFEQYVREWNNQVMFRAIAYRNTKRQRSIQSLLNIETTLYNLKPYRGYIMLRSVK